MEVEKGKDEWGPYKEGKENSEGVGESEVEGGGPKRDGMGGRRGAEGEGGRRKAD